MKRILLTLIVTAAAIFSANAERYYYFEHLKPPDGLPSNTIYCTIQDRNGFMWVGTRDGLCRYDGRTFVRIEDLAPDFAMSGFIMTVEEDSEGRIWFSSSNFTGYYDPDTGKAEKIGRFGNDRCNDIQSDGQGEVWFATDKITVYNSSGKEFREYAVGESGPAKIALDSLGTIWILLQDGTLYTYDRLKDTFNLQPLDIRVKDIRAVSDGHILLSTTDDDVILLDCISLNGRTIFSTGGRKEVRCFIEAEKGEFWIGTDSGLFIRRAGQEYDGEALHDDATPNSISADLITCIDKDSSGDLWIGTYYTGLNIWRNRTEETALYFTNPSENSAKGKVVRDICSDAKGNIWFCTEDGYLNRLNPQTQEMDNYVITPGLNMHGLVIDENHLWICSYGKGLYRFNTVSCQVEKHYDLPGNTITIGLKTMENDIIIGSTQGMYIWNRNIDKFELVHTLKDKFIHSLYQDSRGFLWVGTYGDGIICIDRSGRIYAHVTGCDKQSGLTSRFITSFFEDSRHRMWVTTEGGGVCHTEPGYDITDLHFSNISRNDGLPSNITCSATEGNDGTIFISTTNGIAFISGENSEVVGLINYSNEVTGYQYSYGAVHTTQNGVTYFGNTDGMIALMPSKIKVTDLSYPIAVTSIEASNSEKTIKLNSPGTSAMKTTEIEVRHKDASAISIKFVVPSYTTQNILYHYTISKGKNALFTDVTYDNSVTLTGLRPGKYRFDVGVVGSDRTDSDKSLGITITPHPLLSSAAFIIYGIFAVLTLCGLIIIFDQANRRDKARKISKLASNKEKELYKAKINYFTNITHEIRTPLTLIKMPLDKLIAKGAYTPESEKDLRTIQENTDRLLSLTNQLLDMRKMEQNEIKLSCTKEDICKITRKSCGYFEQIVQDQHITITTDIPEEPIYLMCAKDSIMTILSNLLSNAVKYGNDRIHVSVSQEKDIVYVRVESNGEHIPDNDKERIFNIFYQREANIINGRVSQGTGLGLPYARTLANMHNGKLYIDRNVTDMNSFVLELPAGVENHVTEIPKPAEGNAVKDGGYDSSRHTILIVEDTTEMRDYLAGELSDTYNILTAANGADALAIIKDAKVDLVVSDIMMPIMDGGELCTRIKTDSDLSHVPVILLTAAVGVETHIESLEVGADGYIEKPFPIELLRSNISNLFKNKEISYQQFINKPLTHYNSVTVSKVDEEYMDRLHDFIMKHIAETDLNIENLTTQLGTSKSSLYRKLKANTGLSINEYIRVCRLKQAAELLSSQKYKINEVAFMTGFSSPSYFATCFQKQFNLSPSEFVKNLGQ